MPNQSTGPGLSGLRVIDASTILAAPLMCSLLGDFGADVIKVEHPVTGDPVRRYTPQMGDTSLTTKVTNRNKRSVTINFNVPEGVEVFYRLVSTADVVVMNFRPHRVKAWKIDYDDLRVHKPDLVMMHLTAFGRTGPYAQKPGFARIAESFAGLTYINGYPDRPPVFNGYPVADGIGGIYGAFAIMTALHHRANTGEDQLIDLGLYEPVLRMMEDFVVAYGAMGQVKERNGNAQPHVVPNDVYPTKDGTHVAIPASTPSMWQRLCVLLDNPITDQYPTNEVRLQHRELIDGIVSDFTMRYTSDELIELLEANQIAVARIFSVRDLFDDPHIQARGSLATIHDDESGQDLVMQAPVPKFSRIPPTLKSVGPTLGQHSDEVFDELGMAPDEIARLRDIGAV